MKNTVSVQSRMVKFPWGEVVATHAIGDYTVIEYLAENMEGKDTVMTKQFFAYDATKPVGKSCDTLEQALISAIAHRYDGKDTQADRLICKMLGLLK